MTIASIEGAGGRSSLPAGVARCGREALVELLRTNDAVKLSWVTALLAAEGIKAIVLDAHTSAIEGSIGAIPRRAMVRDEDAARARRILAEAGEAQPT